VRSWATGRHLHNTEVHATLGNRIRACKPKKLGDSALELVIRNLTCVAWHFGLVEHLPSIRLPTVIAPHIQEAVTRKVQQDAVTRNMQHAVTRKMQPLPAI